MTLRAPQCAAMRVFILSSAPASLSILESLQPYNTVGKLKSLRVTQADVDTQQENLEILVEVERLRNLVADLGATAAYLSQAEMLLESGHPWIAQAQAARREILDAGARLRATRGKVASKLAPTDPEARRSAILGT